MLKEFKAFVAEEKLFSHEDRILLAVSGGIDSVVMCDLFSHAGFSFGIAHNGGGMASKGFDVSSLSNYYKCN